MKVVIDTNVIVSALLSPESIPGQIVRLWREDIIEVLSHTTIINELREVMAYSRIKKKLSLPSTQAHEFIELLEIYTVPVKIPAKVKKISLDMDDDIFLHVAYYGKAECIISGDKHLLDVKQYKGIPVLKPAEFIVYLRERLR